MILFLRKIKRKSAKYDYTQSTTHTSETNFCNIKTKSNTIFKRQVQKTYLQGKIFNKIYYKKNITKSVQGAIIADMLCISIPTWDTVCNTNIPFFHCGGGVSGGGNGIGRAKNK